MYRLSRNCLPVSGLAFLAFIIAAPDLTGAPMESDVLAEGPMEISITLWNAKKKETFVVAKAELFRLTKTTVVYRIENDSRVQVKDARDGSVLTIEAREPRAAWFAQGTPKEFVGKTLPNRRLDTKPLESTKNQEERFLFFNLERLSIKMEMALSSRDTKTVEVLRSRAKALAAYIEQRGFNNRLGGLYASLETYSQEYEKLVKERTELFRSIAAEWAKQNDRQRSAQSAAQLKSIMGLGQLLFAAMPGSDYGRINGVPVEFERPVDLKQVAGGIGLMMESSYRYRIEQAQIDRARGDLKSKLTQQLEAHAKQLRELRERQSDEVRKVGSEDFGLAKKGLAVEIEELTASLTDKFDYQSLIQIQMERAVAERGKDDNRDNPYRLLDLCFSRSLFPASGNDAVKQAEQYFESAQKCVQTVKLVPDGAIYNAERLEILLHAASFANQAADLEIGYQSLSSTYNRRSLYAMRILDQVEELAPIDFFGRIREQRMFALSACSQIKEATDLVLRMGNQNADNPGFQFRVARTYGAAGDAKKVAEHLERALKAGFTNIQLCKRFEDLKSLTTTNPTLKAIVEVKGAAKLMIPTAPFSRNKARGVALQFENKANFPLTNVKLKLFCYTSTGILAGSQDLDPLDRINPGKTAVITKIPVTIRRGSVIRLTIVTDQGKKERMPVQVIAD